MRREKVCFQSFLKIQKQTKIKSAPNWDSYNSSDDYGTSVPCLSSFYVEEERPASSKTFFPQLKEQVISNKLL